MIVGTVILFLSEGGNESPSASETVFCLLHINLVVTTITHESQHERLPGPADLPPLCAKRMDRVRLKSRGDDLA